MSWPILESLVLSIEERYEVSSHKYSNVAKQEDDSGYNATTNSR